MSSGHFHSSDLSPNEARQALSKAYSNKRFWNWMKGERFRVDRDFDIPYLAGYSKSGKIIYVDRHVPMSLVIAGRRVNILPFLIVHERTEKALMDFLDYDYYEAHPLATYAEHVELKKMNISPSAYERALDPYIKADLHQKITKVPAELDLKPYRDSRDLKLIARMQEHLA